MFFCLLLFEGTFTSPFKDKTLKRSNYFSLMVKGSGSGTMPLTNETGSGSRRPKNIRIRRIRIRIRNTGLCGVAPLVVRRLAVRHARVWFSPHGGFPHWAYKRWGEERNLGEWQQMNVLYESNRMYVLKVSKVNKQSGIMPPKLWSLWSVLILKGICELRTYQHIIQLLFIHVS